MLHAQQVGLLGFHHKRLGFLLLETELVKRRTMLLTCTVLVFLCRTVRSNSRVKAATPNNEKESTTNDNGSSTDEAESEGNNRLEACDIRNNIGTHLRIVSNICDDLDKGER